MSARSSSGADSSVAVVAEAVLRGDARALARAMTWVENADPGAEGILEALYGKRSAAPRLGFTGPPGAGKSTLVAEYTRMLRAEGLQVGVIAVDPTSPFTGGAILGDRVRMNEHATDPKVFIRSMATRGSLGGLAARTSELCELLDAWGSQTTLVETVGVGQSELDVAEASDTTIVVLTPESGDAIQALKAGLMEIAEVIVLNKADHPGADAMEAALRASLAFRPEGARPLIVRTVATSGTGFEALHQALRQHRDDTSRPDVAASRRREKTRARIRHAVREGLLDAWLQRQGLEQLLDEAAEDVVAGRTSPYRAARDLIERMTHHGERSNANAS